MNKLENFVKEKENTITNYHNKMLVLEQENILLTNRNTVLEDQFKEIKNKAS